MSDDKMVNSLELEFQNMNKTIRKNIKFKLNSNQKAAYIGSSPILSNINHIAELVSSDYYILCDTDFKEEKEFRLNNCFLQITPKNGDDLLYDKMGFVLLDQAVEYKKIISKLKKGTYFYFWCLDEDDLKEFGFLKEFSMLGLKQIQGCFFIKT